MKRLLIISLLLAGCSVGSAFGQFVPSGTIISIDTVSTEPGSSFSVGVRMSNNGLDIAGLQVPLRFTSPYLMVDSVSFAGSVKPSSSQGAVTIDNLADTLAITLFPGYAPTPFPTISTSSGLIATIHFSLSVAAPDGIIPIDTTFSGYGSLRWNGVSFSDPTGMGVYLPGDVIEGAIIVEGGKPMLRICLMSFGSQWSSCWWLTKIRPAGPKWSFFKPVPLVEGSM